jgi:hypothetical protein
MLVRSFFALSVVRFDIILGRASGDKEHGEGDEQTPQEGQPAHSFHDRHLSEAEAYRRRLDRIRHPWDWQKWQVFFQGD